MSNFQEKTEKLVIVFSNLALIVICLFLVVLMLYGLVFLGLVSTGFYQISLK